MNNYSSSIQANIPIITLNNDNFTIGTKELICLKYSECYMILFHTNNIEEKKLFEIWNDAASKNPGAKLAECNVMINKEIANAFITVKSDCNHPFYWAGVNQYPFILVYRGGWPQAFYNGNRTTLDIINYSLQLACKSCYTEKEQKFKGIGVDTSIQETSANPTSPTPTKSTNFTGGNYRGYGTPIYQNATYGNAIYGNATYGNSK